LFSGVEEMIDRSTLTAQRPEPAFGLAALFALLRVWRRRRRERAYLLKLDDRCLKDIGITRWDAVRECEKPFWKA